MRNRFLNHPVYWSMMIVLTLSGWQSVIAVQSNRSIGYRTNTERIQDEALPNPETQDEAVRLPVDEKEVPLVEDRFVGWQAVGQGTNAERLSNDLRANWVMVDDNGLLKGQVLGLKSAEALREEGAVEPIPEGGPSADFDANSGMTGAGTKVGMNVHLLNRGRLLGTARLDPQNRFEFQGVKPGNYALVGYGPSGFFAFGFNVLPYADGASQPRELYIPAIARSGKPITDWVTTNAPKVHFRPFGKLRFGEGIDDPPRLYGITGLRTFLTDAKPSTTIVSHPAATTDDGRLLGRVHHINSLDGRPMDMRTLTVQLVKDGQMLKQIGTDNYGVFEFSDVAPGPYELRAAGADGLAAIQIEVVAAGDPQALPIDIALISPETIGWLNHYMHESAYFAAISGPRPNDCCNRCGQRNCQCGHGHDGGYDSGYGSYGDRGYGYGGYGYGQGNFGYGPGGYGGGYGGYGGYGPSGFGHSGW